MTLSDVVPQIAFASQSTESRLDQEYSIFRLVRWAWQGEILKCSREVFSSRFRNASRMTDHVKEELDVVQIAIKSTTATQKPDKLTMASTDHGTRTGLRISNAIRFPVAFPCARFFDVIAVTLQ